jgi:hypothetical protein
MKPKQDTRQLTRQQRIGYWLIGALGTLQQIIYHTLVRELVWRSANGKCTPVRKMDTMHLHNAYRMCLRNGSLMTAQTLLTEIERRNHARTSN